MRTIIAAMILIVGSVCQAGDYTVDASRKGTDVYAGWGGPAVPYRIHLARVTNNTMMPFSIVSTITPSSATGNTVFMGVASGQYIVMMEIAPFRAPVGSDPITVP